ELLEAESQRSAEAIRGQNQEAEKGGNRSQESRHSCRGHCSQSITKKLIEALPQFPLEEMEKRNVRKANKEQGAEASI
ncbi:hypothetical protein NE450_14965, partial [[Eubacterium] rectale]|nr:hypothetical protein [Agathobacter rectalis]